MGDEMRRIDPLVSGTLRGKLREIERALSLVALGYVTPALVSAEEAIARGSEKWVAIKRFLVEHGEPLIKDDHT